MSSLIDVSFLLLIYFLVTSTLDPKEADLGLTLPGPPGATTQDVLIDWMRIEVLQSGQIVVNQEVLNSSDNGRELPMLQDRLRTYVESARLLDSETRVIVAAEDSTRGQRFIDVLNTLAAPGIEVTHVALEDFSE